MSFWYKEEVEDVPDHVKSICELVFKKNGIENTEVTIEAACLKSESICSKIHRLIASNNEKTFSIIAKMALVNEYLRIISCTPQLFYNECLIYQELLPKFDELQKQIDLRKEEWYGHALCYGSTEKPTEAILLEDLKQSGYQSFNMTNILQRNEEILMTLKELAKFHAMSFVLRVRDEEFYNNFTNKIIDYWATKVNKTVLNNFLTTIINGTMNYFVSEEERKYLNDSLMLIPYMIESMHSDEIKSKHAVIVHGSMWRRKALFKYENKRPVLTKILDYQQCRLGRVGVDIHHFLLNLVDYKSRQANYKSWLEYYYKCFEEFLKKFDIRAEDVYPRDVYNGDLKKTGKLIFASSVLLASFYAREAEISLRANKSDDDITEPAKHYKETVVNLMETMKELGYL